jgi:hypothetical protein
VNVTPPWALHVADVVAGDVDAQHTVGDGALRLEDVLDVIGGQLAALGLVVLRRSGCPGQGHGAHQ